MTKKDLNGQKTVSLDARQAVSDAEIQLYKAVKHRIAKMLN